MGIFAGSFGTGAEEAAQQKVPRKRRGDTASLQGHSIMLRFPPHFLVVPEQKRRVHATGR
jgi:hypothetical protein